MTAALLQQGSQTHSRIPSDPFYTINKDKHKKVQCSISRCSGWLRHMVFSGCYASCLTVVVCLLNIYFNIHKSIKLNVNLTFIFFNVSLFIFLSVEKIVFILSCVFLLWLRYLKWPIDATMRSVSYCQPCICVLTRPQDWFLFQQGKHTSSPEKAFLFFFFWIEKKVRKTIKLMPTT